MITVQKRFLMIAGLLGGSCLPLAGCAGSAPFARPGTWHETNAPMHNIAVELVNPQDLHRGHGGQILTGKIAVSAVGSGLSSISASPAASGSSSTAGHSSGFGGNSNFSLGMSTGSSTP